MYCFRCGKKLPARATTCSECDTPQKRRSRYRLRMILGLFIFLAGAVAGSLFDTFFFQGQAWKHSFMGAFKQVDKPEALEPMEEAPPLMEEAPPLEEDSMATTPEQLAGRAIEALELPEVQADATDLNEVASVAVVGEQAQGQTATPVPAQAQSQAQSQAQPQPQPPAPVSAQAQAQETGHTVIPVMAKGNLVYDSFVSLEQGEGSNFHAHISHDGQKLVFASNRLKVKGKNTYQCFIKKVDLAAKPELAFSWPGNVWTPELTSDGKKIVFSSDSQADEHIFIYDLEAKNSQQLTSGKTKNMMSAISPDGSHIVYASNQSGSQDLWIMGIDGTNPIRITSSQEADRDPRWSADGRSVVFARVFTRLKKSHIMRVSLDPLGEPETLVGRAGRNWLADVSPCASTLAYVHSESADGSKNTIYLKNLQTEEEEAIKPLGEAEYYRPIWLNDASGLVFHANVGQNRNIYLARFRREQ